MGERPAVRGARAPTWRLIRATNAYLEANEPWKAEPGPAVDARARRRARGAAHRRRARLAGDPATTVQTIWERIGLPGAVARPAAARGGGVGRLPGRAHRSTKGAPLFPRIARLTRPDEACMGWIDNHCHLDDERVPGRRRRQRWPTARAAGVDRLITVGTDAGPQRRPPSRWPPRTTASGRPSACIRTTPSTASTPSSTCSTSPRSSPSASAGSTTTTTTRPATCSGPRSPPRSRSAHEREPPAGHPHPRGVGRHVRHPRRPRACRRARSSTASPAAPTRPSAASTSAPSCRSPGIVTFKAADDPRGGRGAVPARPAPGRDRRALPRAGPAPGQAEPARAGPGRRGGGGGRSRASPPKSLPKRPGKTRIPCFGCDDRGKSRRDKFAFALRRP